MLAPYLVPVATYDPYASPVPHPDGHYVEIAGKTFYYRVFARPEGTPVKGRILLVHGFGGSTNSWNATAPSLAAEGWLVVAVDLPGFGYSEKKRIDGTYSHETNARDLWLLLDLVSPRDAASGSRWNLVGHSMGGDVVAWMAAQRPESTGRVVLVDGAVLGAGSDTVSPGSAVALLRLPPIARAATVLLDRLLRNPASIRGTLASAYGRTPTDAELASYAAPLAVPGTAASLVTIASARSLDEDDSARLKATGLPVALIWGSADTWVVPVDQGRYLSDLLGVTLQLVEGAGHCPMETHPAEFLKLLRNALEPEASK